MKKNKKIAPSLYSKMRAYRKGSFKYQEAGFEGGQYDYTTGADGNISHGIGDGMDPASMLSGSGSGGTGPLGSIVDSVTNDGNAHTYTAAEMAGHGGRLLSGDLTAIVDIGKSIVERGAARNKIRRTADTDSDLNTTAQRENSKQDVLNLSDSNADMGGTLKSEEGNFAMQAKHGGMKYKDGGAEISREEYSQGINRYTGNLNQNYGNDDGTTSSWNTSLYGGETTKPAGSSWVSPTDGIDWNMEGTTTTTKPMQERMKLDGVTLSEGRNNNPNYSASGKERSDYRKNFINNNNYRTSLMNTRQDMRNQDTRKSDRDSRRMSKYGNTQSGLRNFLKNTFGFKEGGMKLDGGMAVNIPGSDAVEFKGNRHSAGGINDGTSEVEHGETKDGVSSKKHGGAQMPYYFSDYVNTDGSKKYGGNSYADAHKRLIASGGTQEQIDALAASQEVARGDDPSKIAQEGGFPSKVDNTRVSTTNDVDPKGNFVKYRGGDAGDYGSSFWTGKLEADKAEYARNFGKKQEGGMKHQGGSFQGTAYDTPASYFGPNEDMVRYNMRDIELGNNLPAAEMEEFNSLTEGVNDQVGGAAGQVGNGYTNDEASNVTSNGNLLANKYATEDKLGLAASMLAPMTAYTMTPGQMPAQGSVTPVEAPVFKYTNMNEVRAQNERDFQKVSQYIKTSGGGPADMINLMSAYDRKMIANQNVSSEENKGDIAIDNMNADSQFKADVTNVGNELDMKKIKLQSDMANVQMSEDQKANKVEALQTAAENINTSIRDRKAYDASILFAETIDGGSGVLGRALTPADMRKQMEAYKKGEYNLNDAGETGNTVAEVVSSTEVPEAATTKDNLGVTGTYDLAFRSGHKKMNKDLNIKTRNVKNSNFGDQAGVGMYNLEQALLQEDYGTEGFMITSATRDKNHALYNKDSLHATGNAVDFGVKDKDGKAMVKYFFDDWDGDRKKLSVKGRAFLQANNAELIDETTNSNGEHFHLEFNKLDDTKRSDYADGHTTDDGYNIYGVQQS